MVLTERQASTPRADSGVEGVSGLFGPEMQLQINMHGFTLQQISLTKSCSHYDSHMPH